MNIDFNFNEFHFIRPFWLLAFIPYFAVLAMMIRSKLSQGNWLAVCDAELLPYLLENKVVNQSRLPLIVGAIAALLAILALAGPTWERLPAPAFRNDSALVIVLDLSRSMQAADVKPNRLVLTRYKISDILKQRKDGQTALITYSGDAFTVTPLTTDTDTIDNQLSALTPEIMPSDGDNISRALDKAVSLLKQAGLQKGQILLLTDGGGDLDEAASKAKSLGDYQLLVLGVGSADGAPIALPSGDFMKDDQGNIVIDKVDIAGLQKLAQAGSGAYHSLTSDDSDIKVLLTTVAAKLQAEGKNENLLLQQWNDMGPWLLLAVLPLAALGFRKGVLTMLLVISLPWPNDAYAFDMPKQWQDLWQTKDQQAQAAYRNKEYDKAAELFENPDWKDYAKYQAEKLTEGDMKEPSTALGYYNQGTIFAKSGENNYSKKDLEKTLDDYKKAIAKYEKALTKEPKEDLKKDIETNKNIVSKELKKVEEELEKQKQENQDDKKESKDQQNQNQQQNKDGNSSDQSEQKQDSQNKDQQNQDEKPEQKPEQSQEDLEKQAQQTVDEDKQKQKEQEQQQAQAEQAKKDEKQDKDKPDDKQAQAVPTEMSKEEQQASEQWLKRIPDDPAGLLRRKFRYQYEQRGQQ